MSEYFTSYGGWAVVTGASSGIGREVARQLAAAGVDVVAVARRLDRLTELQHELESAHGVRVRPVQLDLRRADAVARLDDATSDLDIGLVVSNAGAAHPGDFLRTSLSDQEADVHLNVTTPLQLAHTFGRRLTARGRGGLVFVSSTSAFAGTPHLSNYAATKSYVLTLAEGLGGELDAQGVDVLVVAPGPTRTEMVDTEGADFSRVPVAWMTPEAVARATLRALGRRRLLVPGGVNKVVRFVNTRFMSRRATSALWGSLMARATDDELLAA